MPIDLSSIKQIIEEDFMIDTCRITRDVDLTEDENWDAATMTYSGGDVDPVVYEGKCYVSSTDNPYETVEGGQMTQQTRFFLNIPLEAPDTADGDLVVMTSSVRDPSLVDEEFIVREDIVGTNKVKRKVHMIRRGVTERG